MTGRQMDRQTGFQLYIYRYNSNQNTLIEQSVVGGRNFGDKILSAKYYLSQNVLKIAQTFTNIFSSKFVL